MDDITFFDFENMFAEITKEIELLYSNYGFECVPLNDNLIMSCWMSGDKMIFAFPSKTASYIPRYIKPSLGLKRIGCLGILDSIFFISGIVPPCHVIDVI